MIAPDFARRFAHEWIDAWNSHDIDRILAHYADEFEMASPSIAQIAHEPTGILRGKAAIRGYWTRALAQNPALHFELLEVLVGAQSIVILYRGHRGTSGKAFWFDDARLVCRAAAHYAAAPA